MDEDAEDEEDEEDEEDDEKDEEEESFMGQAKLTMTVNNVDDELAQLEFTDDNSQQESSHESQPEPSQGGNPLFRRFAGKEGDKRQRSEVKHERYADYCSIRSFNGSKGRVA